MENWEKVVRDNEVAVLYSPGYGAGWSTWNSDRDSEVIQALLFHPAFVKWIEDNKKEPIEDVVNGVFGDIKGLYLGGAENLQIKWMQEGTRFEIEDTDGAEQIEIVYRNIWIA